MTRRRFADESDAALVASVGRRQPGAFDELFARHAPSVARFARALVTLPTDADDIVQNVFLAVHRYAGSFRGDASVRTWLLTITRNESSRLRKKQRFLFHEHSLDELGAIAGWGGESPETLAIALEQRDTVAAALARLSSDAQEIIVLRDLEGLSAQETAAVLKLSVAATKSRLHRARLELKAVIHKSLMKGET